MKTLQELFNEYQTEHSFQILGRPFVLSSGRSVYAQLRIKYMNLAINAYNTFMKCEEDFQTIDDLLDGATDALTYSIKPAAEEAVRDLISIGVYDVDTVRVLGICQEWGFFNGFADAYKPFMVAALKIRANLAYNDDQRIIKKESRPRWQITTIGGNCFDAWGNQMKANAMNAVEGAGASIANIFESAADEAEANRQLRKVLNNSEYRNRLREEAKKFAFNIHLVLTSYFPEESCICDTDANALCNNAVSAGLPDHQRVDLVHRALSCNPFDPSIYIRFMKCFTNTSDHAGFLALARFCGLNEVTAYIIKLITDYVKANLGTTENDSQRCRQNLNSFIAQLSLTPDMFPEAFKILNAQDQKLDQEYRTVKGVVLNTRAEADSARQAIRTHGATLEQVLDVQCRADILQHMKKINALQMDPNVKQVYINKYKQQLDLFDKRCRKAQRYVYIQDHDGISFYNGDKVDMLIHYGILAFTSFLYLLIIIEGKLETVLSVAICNLGYIVYFLIVKVFFEKNEWKYLTKDGMYTLEQVMSNTGLVDEKSQSEPPLMTCPKCGENYTNKTKFCIRCGTKVENSCNAKYRNGKINVLVYIVIGVLFFLIVMVSVIKIRNGQVIATSTYFSQSVCNELSDAIQDSDGKKAISVFLPDEITEYMTVADYAETQQMLYTVNSSSGIGTSFELKVISEEKMTDSELKEVEKLYGSMGIHITISKGYKCVAEMSGYGTNKTVNLHAIYIMGDGWHLSFADMFVLFN